MKHLIISSLLVTLLIFLNGCGAAKQVVYMQEIQENIPLNVQEINPIKLQPGDKVYIYIHSRDEELETMFNLTSNQGNRQRENAYTISEDGKVDIPIIGPITAEGLTRMELANLIKYKLMTAKMLRDPTVTVEYANLKFYVLGEVGKPGRIEIDQDYITLLQAIAEAGDLNLTGRRDNVLVLRTEDGIQTPYRVDLTNTQDIYSSSAYYIHQNDIIYVAPTQERANQSKMNANNTRSYAFWLSMFSLFTSAVAFFTR
jgi:polysaccharide export outer membrane protein